MFVYTASTTPWANYIIPCVEAAIGMRFIRPFLTRDHCVLVDSSGRTVAPGTASPGQAVDIRKSIAAVTPLLVRSLRKRYPVLVSAADLSGRVALVDNTPHVMARRAEDALVIACSTYDYQYSYDVLGNVGIDYLHRNFARLIPTLRTYSIFTPSHLAGGPQHRTFQQFAADYYSQLARGMRRAQEDNARALANDHFWLRMTHAMFGQSKQQLRHSGPPTGTRSQFGRTPLSVEAVRWIQQRVAPAGSGSGPAANTKKASP